MTHQQQPIMRLTDFNITDLAVEQLGAGGFGLVFMGPDRAQDGRWFALKTLRSELLALQPQLRELLIEEGLTWVGLWPHPNLAICQTATEIDGRVYLILDYAAGGSLRDLLPQDPPFAARLAWAQHIAAGLVALHTPDPEFLRERPLVHRDLKPENVLVQESGLAQITDFGLAAAVGGALAASPEAERAFALVGTFAAQVAQGKGANQTSQATRTNRFRTRGPAGSAGGARGGVGTIAYMPPEQWQAGSAIGTAADLYAFGLILSELLAGRHGLGDLEEERDEDGWYQLHTQGRPRPLRGGPADGAARLPGDVEALYTALLAKRPEERPTAAQALAGLQRAAQALGAPPFDPRPNDYYPRDNAHRLVFWHSWANACTRFERYEEALTRNDRALALAPDGCDVWNTRGAILAKLGLRARRAGDEKQAQRRFEEALAAHTRALSLARSDAELSRSHGGRAARLNELRRYAEAEAAYDSALTLDRGNGVNWYNRVRNALAWGLTAVDAGQEAEAARFLAAAERYVAAARQAGMNHPDLPRLLADIQRARAQLKP